MKDSLIAMGKVLVKAYKILIYLTWPLILVTHLAVLIFFLYT